MSRSFFGTLTARLFSDDEHHSGDDADSSTDVPKQLKDMTSKGKEDLFRPDHLDWYRTKPVSKHGKHKGETTGITGMSARSSKDEAHLTSL